MQTNRIYFFAKIFTFFTLSGLFLTSCSKECNIKDFEGTYKVDADDKACFPSLTTDEVKYAVLINEIPFIVVDDKTQLQLSLATMEDPGGGCGFTFVAPKFPSGESGTVNISGNNIVISYTKKGSICEAKLNKK